MDPWALHDVLKCADASLLAALDSSPAEATEAHIQASIAAMGAFPEDSLRSGALAVILAAVGEMARAVPA